MSRIPWIASDDQHTPFPDVERALAEPNGLLAVGGSLSSARLLEAYRRGIFPWFADNQPVLWWSPDPRALIVPGRLRLSRSLRKALRQRRFELTLDRQFQAVVESCAAPRAEQAGTWITAGMATAYANLHAEGYAHSVEVWREGDLVGGLYGVSLGGAFFGESMFSRETDASKVALAWLAAQLRQWDFDLIDCQMPTPHLASLGAIKVSRRRFGLALERSLTCPTCRGLWQFATDLDPLAGAGDRQ